MNKLKQLFNNDVYSLIPKDDILARQRYILFRIYTIVGILIFFIFSVEEYSFNQLNGYRIYIFAASSLTLIINYAGLQLHREYKLAYSISIIAGFILIHCATYYSGGIRNPDFLYLGSIILYAYIVLENKGGKITLYVALANIIYFYVLSDFTAPDKFITHTKTKESLDLRHLLTGVTSMFLITALSSYLENAKNAVINKIADSNSILERKNEELKELSLVASGTENSVILTDSEGIIEWVNEGFTRLYGYSAEEIIGKKQQDFLFGPDSDPIAVDLMTCNHITEENTTIEVIKYHKSGSPIWVIEKITKIKDASNNESRLVFMETNITERKNSENRMNEYLHNLEKTNKELDKFAYVVSHDLKAPLRAIGNLTGWIEEDVGHQLPGEVRDNFNIIKQRVIRMEALINGILAYSKAAKNSNPFENMSTFKLVNETIDLSGTLPGTQFKVADDLPVVYSDRIKLQQVFLNLIGNAVKFNPKKDKKVIITGKKNNEFYHFSVTDNGPGIDPRFHEKIFVIFQTIETRDEFESTGVGLAIVKKIVEELGGKIWIESNPGQGSTFHFTIPANPIERKVTETAENSERTI
ncbi:MAG TPA: ATP-binding protein [Bacteroidia bacterium]|nr:ATP-binding protein [Bacteroidia bacterium]